MPVIQFQDNMPCSRQDYLIINVRLPRLELGTSTLSVSRSNQLSYNRMNGG